MLFYNKKMKELLDKIQRYDFNIYNNAITLKKLMELLDPKFIEVNGCVFFNFEHTKKASLQKGNLEDIKKYFGDEIGFEASNNELKIEHYIEGNFKITLDLLKFTLKVIECWEYKLKKQFPDYHFTIVLFFSDESIDTRFYRQRKGETLLEEDKLDEYPGAVLLKKF